MTISDFYDEVARRADTDKTKIGAAETKRVLSEAFKVLAGMTAADAFEVVGKAMAAAGRKLAAG